MARSWQGHQGTCHGSWQGYHGFEHWVVYDKQLKSLINSIGGFHSSMTGPDIKFSESNVPKDEEAEGEDKQIFEQPRDSETRSGSVFNESDNEDPADAGPKSKPKIDQLDDDGMNEMVMDFGGEDYPPKEQPPRKASNNSNESKDG